MCQRLRHRTARHSSPFIPQLEGLEDRLQPSCTILLDRAAASDGRDLMTVTGTTRADTIRITDTGVLGRGSVVVDTFDGLDHVSGGRDADIGEVRISTGFGNDAVVYNLRGHLNTTRLYNIELGDNDDTFDAFLGRVVDNSPGIGEGAAGPATISVGYHLLAGSNLDLRVRGGNNADTINVFANRGVDIHWNAILSLSLAGDAGNDTIGVYYNGGLDGRFSFIANGGWNDDTVTAQVVVGAGDPNYQGVLGDPLRPAQVRDGGGHDSLTYLLADNSHGDALLFASMAFTDFGFGDEAVFTPNVNLIW